MKIIKMITRANLIIALVIVVIFFLLYSKKTMMDDWVRVIGLRWIWVPIVIILVAAILYGRFFFRKKK